MPVGVTRVIVNRSGQPVTERGSDARASESRNDQRHRDASRGIGIRVDVSPAWIRSAGPWAVSDPAQPPTKPCTKISTWLESS